MDINSIGNSATTPVQTSPGAPPSTPAATVTPAAEVNKTSQASPPPSLEQVKQAVDNINASLNANGNAQNVQFAVDPNSKRVVVQVIDQQTDKVIRQIPSEEIIHMSMSLGQKLGQVINQQA